MDTKTIAQLLGLGAESRKLVDQSMLNNLLAILDDKKFMDNMVGTHAPDEREVDVQSLFALVENTLRGATGVVDNVVNPKGTPQAPSGNIVHTPPKQGFNPPLSAISEVACQITCKALDAKNVRETMEAIFHELSSYSWVAKSVITLSAFALYYADFWRLAQIDPSDTLAESMAILKGLPAIITKPLDSPKSQVFILLNDMVKTILDMTECIVDFEHDSKEMPELSDTIDIAHRVYQIIISVLACSIQFTSLISLVDEYKGRDLPIFARKVNVIHHSIERQLEEFKQKKEEIREYKRIECLFNAPTDNVELIKALFYGKDNPQPLFIGSKKTMDKAESLRRKNVLLLISDMRLTDHDLEILLKIYSQHEFHERRYEILWIPIIEQEDEYVMNQFKQLQAQMPWYSVHNPILINKIAIRIIKAKWHYRHETLVVVLDPQGKVKNPNAMNMIQIFEEKAIPFIFDKDIWSRSNNSGFKLLVPDMIFPKIQDAIKAEKCIFLYGGEDSKAIHEIEEYLKKIVADGVSIIIFNVSKLQLFWSRLESCILLKLQTGVDIHDPLMQDILKLYTSFKKDGGFAVLIKGSHVVINGQLATITKVLAQYESWKKQVNLKGFDEAFKEYYEKVYVLPQCHHFYIPNMVGYMPENVKCPICPRMMKNIFTFECCHGAH